MCFDKFFDVVIVDSNEIPRSTAEAVSAAPAQWVSPLTKEQLQQAFIYLLQVLRLCILMIIYCVVLDIVIMACHILYGRP